MKKLILVVALLVAVLLLSWWAKGSNFSVFTMMQTAIHPVTSSATPTNSQKITPTQAPTEILITVTPNGFVPDVLMISQNTKISWVNKSGTTANISSDPQNAFTQLNLGDFGENGSVSLVFLQSGRYHYYNSKNPLQKGTLIVK